MGFTLANSGGAAMFLMYAPIGLTICSKCLLFDVGIRLATGSFFALGVRKLGFLNAGEMFDGDARGEMNFRSVG